MSALLLGSISVVADTSELQRAAFNEAFAEHGLDWQWDRDSYVAMLEENGGADRIAAYAAERGEEVDADAVHATKSKIFQRNLAKGGAQWRPGVLETLREARRTGARVALVTTTSPANVAALLEALPDISAEDFDLVLDKTAVDRPKPDPAVYRYALEALGEDPSDAVAVEDNLGGVRAAEQAGVATVAFPNANTAGHDFGGTRVVDRLDYTELRTRAA